MLECPRVLHRIPDDRLAIQFGNGNQVSYTQKGTEAETGMAVPLVAKVPVHLRDLPEEHVG